MILNKIRAFTLTPMPAFRNSGKAPQGEPDAR